MKRKYKKKVSQCINTVMYEQLCETCLSSGRRMCPIDEIQLQSICPGFQLSVTNMQVCWECCGMVRKWVKFRDKVVKAQEMLADYRNGHNFRSLSNLCFYKDEITSIQPSRANTSVKSEDGYESYEKNPNYDVKQEMFEIPLTEQPLLTPMSEDPIGSDTPLDQLLKRNTANHTTVTPTRVYVREESPHPNSNPAKINQNLPQEKITKKSCIKKKHDTKTEKKVAFKSDSSETETADEFEDEQVKKDEKVERFKLVQVEKDKLLKLMDRARSKQWFLNSRQRKCKSCLVLFKSEDGYKQHMKKHDESAGAHECDICSQRFPTADRARAHRETHLDKCVECVECRELFGSALDYSAHFKNHHSHRDIMCYKCIRMFPTVREYRTHRRTVHSMVAACEFCGKNFKKHWLKTHIKTVHKDNVRTECPICFKMIKGDSSVLQKRHIKYVHKPRVKDEDSFCVECNIQFRTIWNYKAHVKTKHENKRPKSECPQCGKLFVCLRTHMFTHSAEYSYECSECDKKFKRRSKLLYHVRHSHRGEPKPRNKTCSVCQKSFTCSTKLSDHMNTHTGARPHVCVHCGDTFTTSSALCTHTRMKHKSGKLVPR